MVAKRVQRIGAGAGPSGGRKPAAHRRLLAQAVGGIVGASTRLGSLVEVHTCLRLCESGSAKEVSQSRECQ